MPCLGQLALAALTPPAPTDVLLTNDDTVASRADPDHVQAMAVHAYTYGWNQIISHHVLNRTDSYEIDTLPTGQYNLDRTGAPREDMPLVLQRMDPPDVSMFVFFAPMAVLNSVSIQLSLVPQHIVLDLARYGGEHIPIPNLGGSLTQPLYETFLKAFQARYLTWDALRSDEPSGMEARMVWHHTIDTMIRALFDATSPVLPSSPFIAEGERLYHGVEYIPPGGEDVDDHLSRRFVSASEDEDVAHEFARKGKASQLLELELTPGVRIVRVADVNPNPRWATNPGEQEVILAPGNRFVHLEYYRGGNSDYAGITKRRVRVEPMPSPWQPPAVVM